MIGLLAASRNERQLHVIVFRPWPELFLIHVPRFAPRVLDLHARFKLGSRNAARMSEGR